MNLRVSQYLGRALAPVAVVGVSLAALVSASCLPTAGSGQGGQQLRRRGSPRFPAGQVGVPAYTGPERAISKHNLVANANFNDGTSLPWTVSFTAPGDGRASIVNDALCIEVSNRGANNWDAQLRHREMSIEPGRTYSITFKAYASAQTKMRAKIGMSGPPYREYWVQDLKLDETPRTFTGQFTMRGETDPTAEFAFHVGGNLAYKVPEPFSVCLDDVKLEDPLFVRAKEVEAEAPPNVLVNQVGYFPGLPKIATFKTSSQTPQAWRLVNAAGRTVAEGQTTPHGHDKPAGHAVHTIDFSSARAAGDGYVLTVGSDKSHPFNIGPRVLGNMWKDALAYFYHNRSGIEIKLPYAGEKRWTRPAGHLSDEAVPCAPHANCDYELDVAGGWYDAGDHGKYIVNGGVSVWTLLNLWERSQHISKTNRRFADGSLNIPEKSNGVPDLLDEVRWNLAFMLKMQVPDGNELAGMAHHKVHDREWTALGLAPHEDPMPRFLQPVSTAATLNLAAVAAQGARIFKPYDPTFAAECLAAAETAYQAALAHPDLFAPPGTTGGGPYDDTHVDDEFYWAASELFITTGKDVYRNAIESSPFYLVVPKRLGNAAESGLPSPLTWQSTEALGTISLATVPSKLKRPEATRARQAVAAAADLYLQLIDERGYRVPISYGSTNKAPWGSNSFIMNNLLTLAMAYDFTQQRRYLDGVVTGFGYILGRNAMDQSYVSGYGDRPLRNPHHRFWAAQVSDKYPEAPPGAVSGGPNSGLEDPYVQAAGLSGCAAETCFIDHIEAWAVNEITINWNAPFAAVTAFLDDHGGVKAPRGGRGRGRMGSGRGGRGGRGGKARGKGRGRRR